MSAILQRLRRAWFNFQLAAIKDDIAMLHREVEQMRGDLYDLEAGRHALEVELMQLEGGAQ